jgi:hypothetical protein
LLNYIYYLLENWEFNFSQISYLKGIQVYALTLDGNKGMQTLDLRLFKTGTYFYSVTNNKNMIKSDKLIIAK